MCYTLSLKLSNVNIMDKYQILLYYCYTHIASPDEYREEHHLKCLDLGLLGRIIIAEEGINGTVSGTVESCCAYMEYVKSDRRFTSLDFKIESHDGHAFQKLYVRVKPEIVHSSLRHLNPATRTGIHLSPKQFKELKDQEDVVVLDVRSNYEHQVGRFKNAVTIDMENFRDFPEKMKELEHLKNKKVLTYCTGGIKCEKASAYLLEQGFKDVYQLHGGIIKYGLEEGGEDFEGKCYVFDGRVVADINKVNPVIISTCYVCGTLSDRMVNCANPVCNRHEPMCEACGEKMEGACSEECKEHPEKRPYDGTGSYPKELNGYDPYLHVKRS